MEIETLLHEEIESELQTLGEMEVGTNEYKTVVDGLTKLIDRAIEMDKFNIDHEEKNSEREFERALKLQQIEEERLEREFEREYKLKQVNEDKKDRLIKNVLTGFSITLPLIITIWGTNKSLKFEETGTVTTIMGRGFINKLLPNKK